MPEEQGLFQKAQTAVQRYHMLQQGDIIAVGVSGGADSVALLDFLCRLGEGYQWKLLVCHLNHGLRGAEADRDQEFVRLLAKERGLPFLSERADAAAEAARSGLSVEEAGRKLRYAFFARCAGEEGKIATAHTLSDSMETVLLNLCRGTGVRGLRGIPPVRGNIVRPLIGCTRREVEEYCRQRGLSWVEDSTNASPDYSRNRIRLEVIPRLEELNPALPAAMAGLMERMEAQWQMTLDLCARARAKLALPDGGLDRMGFLALPGPVGDALLQELLEEGGGAQSARLVGLMRQSARLGSGAVQLGSGVWFVAGPRRLALKRRSTQAPPLEILLDPGTLEQETIFPLGRGYALRIRPFPGKSGILTEKINKSALKNLVDCGRIKGNVMLRRKKDGDRMAPVWRKAGSRSLKKLCQEAGIPPDRRALLAVAEDDEGIMWAQDFGVDRRCAPDGTDGRFLLFEVVEDEKSGTES
jgi:tRNA(Ile)-lysidine synthase